MQQKPQLTESQYQALNALLREAVAIDAQEKALAERKEANRAALRDLCAPMVNGESRTPAAGLQVKTRRVVRFNPEEALAWALAPENFPAAAPMLSLRKDAISTIVALALQDANLKAAFELNKAGYEAAVREKTHVGLPFAAVDEIQEVSITVKAVQLDDALRGQFEIVPDEPEEPTTEPRPFDEIQEHPF